MSAPRESGRAAPRIDLPDGDALPPERIDAACTVLVRLLVKRARRDLLKPQDAK